MKVLGKILAGIILIPYICVVVFLTACLLNYNDYNITVFGKDSFIIIGEDEFGDYETGDLVIVHKNKSKEISKGDHIFFYDPVSKQRIINYAEVLENEPISDYESLYKIDEETKINHQYLIGKSETATVHHKWGGVLSALESRFGFLLFVIFPVMLLFVYEICMLVFEIKGSKN